MVYTDGGARPNPGASGSGLHGYIYEMPNESSPTDDLKVMKFTDGEMIKYSFPSADGYIYCDKSGKVSSAANKDAIAVNPVHFVEIAESSSNQHTNNYAEMKSLLNGLLLGLKHNVKRLAVISDSEYALKACMSWGKGWAANGWITQKGEPVKNIEVVKALLKAHQELVDRGVKVTAKWIKGHKGHPGNMEADAMATIGVMKSRQGIDDSGVKYYTAKEYIEPKRDRHPLMSLRRMYFNRERERNIPGTYMMADPGKEDHLIGKPRPETVFSVVRMNTPIPLIESVLDAQFRHGQDFNIVMMIKMEALYVPDAFSLISNHGEFAMTKDNKRSHVVLPDNRPMTVERTPIGITMRAIDSINTLETMLDRYIDLRDNPEASNNNVEMKIHDITPMLYEYSDVRVGKEIVQKTSFVKTIAVGQKEIPIELEIDGQTLKLPLKLGLDTLDRNALKRLETSHPTVHVITWKDSTVSVRYASVISCDEGIAIWSNYYADRLFLKKETPAS